jgi:hypothetical protein
MAVQGLKYVAPTLKLTIVLLQSEVIMHVLRERMARTHYGLVMYARLSPKVTSKGRNRTIGVRTGARMDTHDQPIMLSCHACHVVS